ncbi:MAG: hypothetical protein ACSLE5_14730 [Porticoccaceae bacterium]
MNPVFFTDRDLGKRFPQILAAAGVTVERHGDHFAHDCPDEVWLESVGQRGWVVVTHDARIRYKPNELAAVVRHRVAMLVVIGHAPYSATCGPPCQKSPRSSPGTKRPFIAKMYRPTHAELARNPHAPGSVSLGYP